LLIGIRNHFDATHCMTQLTPVSWDLSDTISDGMNVMESDQPTMANQGGKHLVIAPDSRIGVIAINEEQVDRSAVQQLLKRTYDGLAMGIAAEQIKALSRQCESPVEGCSPTRIAPTKGAARQIDANEHGILGGHPRKHKQGSAIRCPDFQYNFRLKKSHAIQQCADLSIELKGIKPA
jgi:hypothetical protein